MKQHIFGFEKACCQARLLAPNADLTPMDMDKDVKNEEPVNESQINAARARMVMSWRR